MSKKLSNDETLITLFGTNDEGNLYEASSIIKNDTSTATLKVYYKQIIDNMKHISGERYWIDWNAGGFEKERGGFQQFKRLFNQERLIG